AQTVDASPEVSTICFGATATLNATYSGPVATSTTSYAISSIPYTPVSYNSGTFVTLSDDSQTGPLPIGFNFCFFGNTYSQFYLGSNGWISFSAGQPTTFTSAVVPSTAANVPKNCIMGPWQDWHPGTGVGPFINYQTVGVAPNRRLIVSWNNCPMYSCTSITGRFQIIIYETTNIIDNYIAFKDGTCAWAGGTAVQGVHNDLGTVAFTVPGRNSTVWTASNDARRYTPNGPSTNTVNWYILPGNTLVGTGTSITVTPPTCQPSTSYYAQVSSTGTCVSGFGTDTIVVNQNNCTPCSATASNNGPVCAGATINLTAGTVTGATYSWTGPNGFTSTLQNPTIPSSSVAAAGTYTVTVTQAASCASCTATTTVVVNPIPAAITPSNNGPVCSGTTLNLSAPLVTGATYSWTGPGGFTSTQQNPSISPVTTAATGNYAVTVTVNGCTSPAATTTAIINNTPNPPIPMINASATPAAICEGGTITLTANNIAGATYAWTGPNGYTAGVRNPPAITNATAANSGTYSLTVTVGGCTSNPATVSIVVNPVPVAPTCPGVSICFGTSATLTATAPGPNYEWYDAATGGTLLASTAAYSTPVLTSTTTYYVQSTNAGCIGPRTAVTVTVTPSILVDAGVNDSICSGSNYTLNVNSPLGAGYSYSWGTAANPGFATTASTVVNPTVTTTYFVSVSDAIGCNGADTLAITVSSPMSLTFTETNVTCAGACNGSVTSALTGGIAPYTYSWTNGSTTQNISAVCAGTYTLTVTDVVGCSTQQVATITEPLSMAVTNTSSNVTCNAACDGTANVFVTGGSLPYTYAWSNGQTTDSISNLCAGSYTCVITDANGCSVTSTVVITQPQALLVDAIPPVTICVGQSATLTAYAVGGTSPYTFNWIPAFTGQSNIVSPATTTTYSVTATDANGCISNQQTVTVTVNPALTVVTSANGSVCAGGSIAVSATAGGGDGTYTYNWMPGNLTSSSITVTPSVTTTYTVTVNDGCTTTPATGTVTITVNQSPVVAFSANTTSGCSTLCVNFTDQTTSSTSIIAWTWNFGNGGASVQSPSNCFETPGFHDVQLTATDANGCVGSSVQNDMIEVIAIPQASFVYSPDPISISAPTVSFTSISTNTTSWNWNFGDDLNNPNSNTSTFSSPDHAYSDVGEYCVALLVSNQGTCFDTIIQCLEVKPDYTLYIPNAFSPTGSGGINDVFAPKGENIAEFSMRIFDRWGGQIFETTDINQGWDGKAKGKSEMCPNDVYVYIIITKDVIGETRQYIGHVTIIK
ncbi:MAG: PKD domain-containing protein, partial [Bacteroidia bacterium]|nr:PKD domain-containing protein [Bacteroidia bacterium]